MSTPKVTIKDIISTTVASSIRQQKNRGFTLFQILRPASNFGVSETRPVFVKRKAQTPWKVYKITAVKPVGDGKKSRVWADVYFGGVRVATNKRLSGVNKRGAWKLINPIEIDRLEQVYTKESLDNQKWQEIVKQDDASIKNGSKSLWDLVESPEDEKISFLMKSKEELITLMRKRYQSQNKNHQNLDDKILFDEELESTHADKQEETISTEASNSIPTTESHENASPTKKRAKKSNSKEDQL